MSIRLRQITAACATVLAASCGGSDSTEPDNTVATVAVTGTSTIQPGGTSQLTAIPRNAAGVALTGMTATWSSSANAVATVSSTGLVTAVANGATTITANIAGVNGTRVVTVQTITVSPSATVTVQGLAFSPGQVDISVGGQVTWNFNDAPTEHNVNFSGSASANNIGNTATGSVTRTFNPAGTFSYACSLHAGMTGTVVVH
jgi:plastocyanin